MANKVPKWFAVVAIIALVWNLLGVMAFAMQVTLGPEQLAAMPEAERNLYLTLPLWALIAFGCAVFGGVLGSLALLLKRRLASALFTVSLVGVVVQLIHSMFFSKTLEVVGPGGMVMPIMVLLIAIGLLWLSFRARRSGWLR